MSELRKDGRGMLLCTPCWDGKHDRASGKGVVMTCQGGKCQCPCGQLAREPRRKVKRDRSLQAVIDTGADVIKIGPRS